LLSLTIPMLVLGVPIYDTLMAIWRRSVRQLWLPRDASGSSPKRFGIMQPDLEHLHHRLLKAGFSTRRVATLLCVGNASLIVFGLLITTFQSHAKGFFLLALLAGAYVLMRHLAIIELRDTGTALLRGLRRPKPIGLNALAYPAWDMIWMCGAVALAKWLSQDYSSSFWHDWFLSLPVWVTPTFALLAMSRTYITIWNRARMRDILGLFFTLQGGLLLSIGLTLVIDPNNSIHQWMIYALVAFAVGHVGIIALRVSYRMVEELENWSHSKAAVKLEGPKRVVLYGAGARCWLLMRQLAFDRSTSLSERTIIGLVDDDPSLHARWVYGYLVLGGREDLPRLISSYGLKGIAVTADLSPESRAAVSALANLHNLEITEWRSDEKQIIFELPKPHLTAALEQKPISGIP
jgi:UDP-GlcNAc:undecaprenyl-phosphate GlcNAc-1-phosphate transferase